MIIAGYAGTGKTTLARQYDKVVEIISMPYAWILPYGSEKSEYEAEKGAAYHVRNPLYPMNMLLEVLKAERENGCVIIPTVSSLIKVLQEDYDRMVVVCYPEDGLQDEYRRRYICRGNSEEFIELFVDQMELFLKPLKENQTANHLILKRGEYLRDRLAELERFMTSDKTAPVSQERIKLLQQHLDDRKKNNGLILLPIRHRTNYACVLTDLDDTEVRAWVYNMGRKLGSELSGFLKIVEEELLTQLQKQMDITIVDKETFEREVDEWLRWNMEDFPRDCNS